jgi:hypothetical protein
LTQTETQAPLDYGLAPPLRRARRRAVLYLCALLALGWVAWRHGPPLVAHAQVLWWQRTCMSYTRPADLVVYSEDATETSALRRRGGYIQMWSGGPALFQELPAYQGLAAQLGYFTSGGTLLYMHERTNEKGERRLVIVYANNFGSPHAIWAWTMEPSTLTKRGRWFGPATRHDDLFANCPRGMLRVMAGQDDAVDASSFSIPFTSMGQPGMLHGTLVGDGVNLTFDGPVPTDSLRRD